MPPHASNNSPPAVLTARPTPIALLRAAGRRWLFTLAVAGMIGFAAGCFIWHYTPLQYNSEVRLQVNRAPAGVVEGDTSDAAAELRGQAELVKNPLVLQLTAEETEVAEIAAERRWKTPADKLGGIVQVEAIQKDSAIRIRVSDDNAAVAHTLARATANGYLKELTIRRQRYIQQLKNAIAQEAAVEIVNETPTTTPAAPRVDPRLGAAVSELAQVRLDQQKTFADLAALRTADQRRTTPTVAEASVTEAYLNDTIVQQKLRELKPLEADIAKYIRIAALGEKEPSLRPYLDRRDTIEKDLTARRTEIRNALLQLARETATGPDLQPQIKAAQERSANLTRQEKNLEDEIASLQAAAAKVVVAPPPPVVHVEKPRDSEARRKLEANLHQAETEGIEPFWVSLHGEDVGVDAASVERRQILAGLGCGGGLLIGVLFVGFVEFRSRRVSSARELSTGLGLTVFGALPYPKETAKALSATGKTADALDALRSAILGSVREGPCVILVTGTGDGAGKSALAAHLAASLARSWHKTVLIDANRGLSGLRRLFRLGAGPGLAEVLHGEVEPLDAIQQTAHNRLWVLPAGRLDSAAVEALKRVEANAIIEPLKEQFDCVIVDVAGLGTTRDVLEFGHHADAILLAVIAGVDRLPEVHTAQQQLEALEGPVVGVALLGVHERTESGMVLPTGRREAAAVS